MTNKPTYEELEKQVKALHNEALVLREEKKTIQEQLNLSKIILSATPDLLVLKDRDFVYQAVNPAFCKFLGKTEESIIGKTDFDLFPRFKAEMYRRDDLKVIKTDKPQIQDEDVTGEDEKRWLRMAKTPVLSEKGASIGVLCSVVDITNRKRAEESLERAKHEKETILDSLLELVVYMDLEMRILWANIAACKSVDLTRDELIGRYCFEIWGDSSEPCSDCVVARAIKTGQAQEIEKTTPDGRSWFNIGCPVRDEKNTIIGGIEVVLEITEHKQAEEALWESEEKLNAMIQSIGDHISMMDKDLNIVWANETAKKIFGNNIIGKKCYEVYHQRKEPCDPCITLKAFQDGKVHKHDTQVIDRNGKTISFHCTANVALRDKEGTPTAVLEISRDITKQKSAEEALKESEEKYRSMMESMKDAAYIASKEFCIEYMNPRMISRIGRDAAGELCHKAFYDNDAKCSWCVFDRIQEGEHVEYELANPKDNRFYTITNSPIYHAEGDISKLTIFRDITESKAIESQLRQARKMESIGTLAGGIAHDFNNILGIIVGNTELAMDDVPEWNPAKHNLEEIRTAGMRARDVVKQILAFSRQSPQGKKPVRISRIIRESLKLLRSSIPTTIEIHQNISSKSDIIRANPTQINQVLINLCTNAAQAMGEKGGVLEVRLEDIELDENSAIHYHDLSSGKYVRLTVSDTGSGIEPKILERIFDPYFTTKKVGEGSGMGLSVVQGIVKTHGGYILVDSELGKGTTFQVFFPYIESKPEPEIEITAEIPMGKERILFVDDEKAMVNAIQPMIERLGYKVTARTSSIEALEAFRANPDRFDLIITDFTMPNMTGMELSKALLKLRSDIPIILCTGYSEHINEDKAKGSGVRAFLMKPVVLGEIANIIRKLLDDN